MNAAEITLSPATEAPVGAGQIVTGEALRIGEGRTRRFVGREHGAGISYFLVDYEPGEGPGLHWHPYTETWVVLAGTAEITIGDRRVIARAGDTVTGPAGVWHRFENAGEDRLRVLCIHASDVIIQTWADAQ
ncbi:cupin domain-containing protein [Microbacterium immunditiarum]|uniref:Mannose-6-phosphate isomerase-like protein (Cupin superfamily) n=1 Tax=Microbacterium immunditiarum TaxID=337480 RepID=A0A7Y9GND6_9MICO|nr:cupin domain-containing protein [Microbacterium immunditiarum]NYE19713.1 mannose-6-phosphate isomerase-like protein (cupin superfamily) [Microbacterium immunditiarum]